MKSKYAKMFLWSKNQLATGATLKELPLAIATI